MKELLADRAGPLLARAEAFSREVGRPLELGAPGVVLLTQRIEGFLRGEGTVDEEADRVFVEGAGALLAVLLLDQLPGASHRGGDGGHTLRITDTCSFDPFAAIDEVLDAPSPRAALAASIRQAEGMRPKEGSEGNAEWAAVRAHIVPRLLGPSFQDRLANLGEQGSGVYFEPVAADVRLSLAVRHGNRVRFVRAREMGRWGVEARVSIHTAIGNLERSSLSVRLKKSGPLTLVSAGDGLDAARLLLPAIREQLGEILGWPYFAAVPHRDALWAAAHDQESALHGVVRAETETAAHPISTGLFVVDREGLVAP